MQQQEYRQQPVKQDLSDIAAKLATIQVVPVRTTRIVRLRYDSCCGCGCSTMWVQREVPADDSIKDLDWIDSPQLTDKTIDEPEEY